MLLTKDFVGMTTEQILAKYYKEEVTQIININGVSYKHLPFEHWFIYDD